MQQTGLVATEPKSFKPRTTDSRQRKSGDWPLAQAAAALRTSIGKVTQASIVLGAVVAVPLRAKAAEQSVVGQVVTEQVAAAKVAVQGAKPPNENRYKLALLQSAVKRALLAAAGKRWPPFWCGMPTAPPDPPQVSFCAS